MTRIPSPLRYPGGKTSLYPLVWQILQLNRLCRRHYVEPYAGGCGLALALLYGGHVSDIHINDIDRSIWAFWHSVLENTDEFAQLIRTAPLTIDEWHRQREVHSRNDGSNPLALGFAAFFLNRTNRSGIIGKAGVIGGWDQSGPYKIDCRFNREDLERRVRRVAKYSSRIHLTCLDAL
ncbi:MAG: DNA adenine methylase, partial [Rhodobacteraceae bacterium]|nr:DNA adenine methylase [Paracoccaceae bacterium]